MPNYYTKKEIADILGLNLRTFQRILKDRGLELPRGLIPTEWLENIKSEVRKFYEQRKNKKPPP